MPVFHNNNLDDPLVLDVQSNFAKGQVSNARANLLDPQQGARLRNVVLDYAGVLESRRGFRDFGDTNLSTATTAATGTSLQGLWYFDTLTSEQLIAAVGGNLYAFDGSDWAALSGATGYLATTGAVWFTQVADKLYFTSGTGNLAEWDGTEIEPDVSTAATGLRYLVSHGFRVFGAANIDELWCSYVLPDAGSEFWVDESGVGIVDETGHRITIGYKTFFGSNATFRVGQGDGDKITALVPWSDFNLLVFKEGSTYAVNTNPAIASTSESTGTDVAQFIVRTVSNRIGCVSHRSAVQVDNDCFFLSRDGVRSVVRTIQDGTQGVSPALSYPVDDIIRRINWDVADVACAAFWRGKYILAVPVDSSTVNNLILVWDKNLQAWYYWDGLNPIEFCVTRFGGSPQKLVVLENSGNVLELRDWFGFEASGPSDYSDLLAASDAVAGVTGSALSAVSPLFDRSGATWFYRLSAEVAGAEGVAAAAVSSSVASGHQVRWTAPTAAGTTLNIYRYCATGGETPDSNDYMLLLSVPASGFYQTDYTATTQAVFDQLSYVGQHPLDSASDANETRPTWQIRTRALTFQDPVSPKKPNHVELEFDRSNAIIDTFMIVDGEQQSDAIATQVETGSGFVHLPVTLPFKLGEGKVVRKRYNVDDFDPGRELQVEIQEAAGLTDTQQSASEYLRLREINMSAFVETMEDQE